MSQTPIEPAATIPFDRTMKVVTVLAPEQKLRTHLVTGNISVAPLRALLQALYTSREFDPDMNALWDLRQADFSRIMPEDVRELMHVVVSHWSRRGLCHSALLVATETEFDVARTYVSQFGRNAPCQMRVFLDLNEARQWLGLGECPSEAVSANRQTDSPSGR